MRHIMLLRPKFLSLSPSVQNVKFTSGPIIDLPDNTDIKIPGPKERHNEPIEQRKARLVYQSRKRGMLENDLLLSSFVHKYLDKFGVKEIEEYDMLINGPSNDWDIYNWALGLKETPQEYEHGVMTLLREHTKNLKRESRLRQPDLNVK